MITDIKQIHDLIDHQLLTYEDYSGNEEIDGLLQEMSDNCEEIKDLWKEMYVYFGVCSMICKAFPIRNDGLREGERYLSVEEWEKKKAFKVGFEGYLEGIYKDELILEIEVGA